MPTNRKRRTRKPRQNMPEWAKVLLETGKEPERDTQAWNEYLGWKYFIELIPEMPTPDEVFRTKPWKK